MLYALSQFSFKHSHVDHNLYFKMFSISKAGEVFFTHFNPFQPSIAFHIESCHLVCTANQMTDFYLKCINRLKWVKVQIVINHVTFGLERISFGKVNFLNQFEKTFFFREWFKRQDIYNQIIYQLINFHCFLFAFDITFELLCEVIDL